MCLTGVSDGARGLGRGRVSGDKQVQTRRMEVLTWGQKVAARHRTRLSSQGTIARDVGALGACREHGTVGAELSGYC